MYSRICIRNFRALQDLAIDDLGRVNLFIGPNNVGKTSLLEAMWLFQGPGNPTLTRNIGNFRGIDSKSATPELLWHALFHRLSTKNDIEIEGEEVNGNSRFLRITLSISSIESLKLDLEAERGDAGIQKAEARLPALDNLHYEYTVAGSQPVKSSISVIGFELSTIPMPQSVYLSARAGANAEELAKRFTNVQDAGRIDALEKSVRLLEPSLKSLYLAYVGGGPLIRGHLDLLGPVPLPLLGGGCVRLVDMLLATLTSNGGLVFIDEIENGLYHKNLKAVWLAIDSASRDVDAQIFATTHSFECVQAAVDAFANGHSEDFRLHRLERKDDEVGVTTYDHETASAALEMNLEVR